jgi:hypothetical protein
MEGANDAASSQKGCIAPIEPSGSMVNYGAGCRRRDYDKQACALGHVLLERQQQDHCWDHKNPPADPEYPRECAGYEAHRQEDRHVGARQGFTNITNAVANMKQPKPTPTTLSLILGATRLPT